MGESGPPGKFEYSAEWIEWDTFSGGPCRFVCFAAALVRIPREGRICGRLVIEGFRCDGDRGERSLFFSLDFMAQYAVEGGFWTSFFLDGLDIKKTCILAITSGQHPHWLAKPSLSFISPSRYPRKEGK